MDTYVIIYKLNEGKNRAVYKAETVVVNAVAPDVGKKELSEKLSSGSYCVLGAFFKESGKAEMYVIGKIRK